MELKKITDADLSGKGVVGLPDEPQLSTLAMQNKLEEIVRDVVIPAVNQHAGCVVTAAELDAAFDGETR